MKITVCITQCCLCYLFKILTKLCTYGNGWFLASLSKEMPIYNKERVHARFLPESCVLLILRQYGKVIYNKISQLKATENVRENDDC